jgi:hypothetical protein
MFNKTKWEPKQMLSAKDVVDDSVAAERAELDKQKKEFATSKEKEHTEKLMSSIDHQIKGTIEKTIDPKGQMGAFVKGKAIDEVLSKATEFLKKDSRFQNIVKQLNSRAAKEGYSAEAMTRIKSTYFTKYKAILLPIIKSVRAEALKGTKSRIKKETEVNDTTERANRDTTVRNTSGNNGNSKKPNPGESSLDFLMRRAK